MKMGVCYYSHLGVEGENMQSLSYLAEFMG